MKKLISFLNWHQTIGKLIDITLGVLIVSSITLGLIFGLKNCKKENDIIYSNTFLGEEVLLHDSNYSVTAVNTFTSDNISIIDKKGNQIEKSGHFVCVYTSITQLENSTIKPHMFDKNDFKLKDHTGVYIPANEIASMVGWDMIDIHWDQAKNGCVISSADFETRNSIEDYNYIGKTIKSGLSFSFTVFFEMNTKYNVENEIMVMEVDFFVGGYHSSKKRGEDIILLNRPENLKINENQ